MLEVFQCPALICYSSLTLVLHTEQQSTKLLADFTQAHPHTDKNLLGNIKHLQTPLEQDI